MAQALHCDSRAAIQAGLQVISVDHKVDQPFAPIVALDLTSNSGVSILWDILSAPGLGCALGFALRHQQQSPGAMREAGV